MNKLALLVLLLLPACMSPEERAQWQADGQAHATDTPPVISGWGGGARPAGSPTPHNGYGMGAPRPM